MILGIDLGTSVVKAASFSLEGRNIAVASRRTVFNQFGDGRIEQDLETLVMSVGEVIAEVCTRSGGPPQAIGITGQSDGLWLLDAAGRAIRPAISWLDDRGNPFLQRWIDSGVFEEVFRRNANAIFSGSQAPLMAALAATDPASLEAATTASYVKDAILQRLTGVRVTDASDASLPFLDIRKRDYDPEILRLLRLERYARLLAPVMPAPGQAFPLNAAGAELTGLPQGIPVHAGPFDLVACPMGAGVRTVGDGLIIVGTTLACEVMVDRIDTAAEPVGMTLCMPTEGRWIRSLPATVGTAALDWVLNLVGIGHDGLDALLARSAPGANGVTALPYFSATGERAPFCDVEARGQLAGLSTATKPADLVMAVCQSVAYAARHCIEAAGLSGRLAICGGGSSSPAWTQMLADVLQTPLYVAPRPEVGARGACIAAMDALGLAHDADMWTRSEGIIEPRRENAQRYADGYAHYLEMLAAARPLWHSPHRKSFALASPPPKSGRNAPCPAI